MLKKFRITNMWGTTVWEGEAISFKGAWDLMFDATKTPEKVRSIVISIERGLWIEKII